MSSTKAVNTKVSLVPFVLVTSLFFLWGLTSNLLPVLIPHLKKACQLTDFQSAFIDSAYWIGYFLIALPAGLVMKRLGYKKTIIIGLLIAATGSFLFFPAAEIRTFGLFLGALFIVASGMTFLETAANPYMTILGSPETASQRLNFAQAFNGLGAFIAGFFISKKILSGIELTDTQKLSMTPEQIKAFLDSESQRVQMPYLVIGIVLVLVAILFVFTKFPPVKGENKDDIQQKNEGSLLRHRHFVWGVVAQFFYVGGQVCVSSFFIRYAKFSGNLPELEAANYLGFLLLGFMIGRYFGTFLMRYVAPNRLLAFYALANVILLAIIVFVGGQLSIYAMIGVEFFMSIMFPTIFSLAIKDLGEETKIASSFLVMSIVGGALFPVFMGKISDASSIQTAYIVPMICFFVVGYYGLKGYKQ
jgi:MFS transporter, FHS family, L-fucose permease